MTKKRTHWIYLEEWFCWHPIGRVLDDTHPHLVRIYTDHYAKVTEEQYNRLRTAHEEILKVSNEIKEGQR